MIVAGWADGYRNATFRVFEELDMPKRLLFGPWSHASPESALPGPHIDLVPEMIRWWNRWLRDDANGIDEEPPITLFARRSTKLEPDGAEVRGDWRYEPGWPLDRVRTDRWELDDAQRPIGAVDVLEVRGDVGVTASISCAGLLPFGQPFDQRPDEAYSLVYDFGELDEELEILGYPTPRSHGDGDRALAFLSAKLCDVFEDGTSILVSRGFLNLTRRDSLTDPQPLEPGRSYRVVVELDVTSWTFERGHRVRLDLAGSDWPERLASPTARGAHDRSRRVLLGTADSARTIAHRRSPRPSSTAAGPTRLRPRRLLGCELTADHVAIRPRHTRSPKPRRHRSWFVHEPRDRWPSWKSTISGTVPRRVSNPATHRPREAPATGSSGRRGPRHRRCR